MNRIPQQDFEHLSNLIKHYLLLNFEYRSMLYSLENKIKDLDLISIKNNYPIVVLIGGPGGSGKSTFINFCQKYMNGVYEESTIDACKDVLDYIITKEPLNSDGSNDLQLSKYYKSDMYRTFLSKLKNLWCEIDDGPNSIVVTRIEEIIERGEIESSLIFVNVREPDQIKHLKELLEKELNAVVVTLAIIRVPPESFENISDRTTLDYKYDIYVKNDAEIEKLEEIAKLFCISVKDTNFIIDDLYTSLIKNF